MEAFQGYHVFSGFQESLRDRYVAQIVSRTSDEVTNLSSFVWDCLISKAERPASQGPPQAQAKMRWMVILSGENSQWTFAKRKKKKRIYKRGEREKKTQGVWE